MTSALERARAALRAAQHVVAFTGAGVSAESGIATYRGGSDALWATAQFERYANPRGYRAHLPASYEWYRARARAVAAANPNPAHVAIVELEQRTRVTVVTQNVDGLHARAGSTDVIELHGHLRSARCDRCGHHIPWDQTPGAPRCPSCDGMLRPAVVMFEELLSEHDLTRARDAATTCDLLLSIGTSNLVWPARELPLAARDAGALVVIVNPDMAGQPAGERIIQLTGRAGEVVPRLVA